MAHLGGIIMRGPGLTVVEATAVTANGRISPEDSGLWKDSQIAPLKKIVDFAHSQGQKVRRYPGTFRRSFFSFKRRSASSLDTRVGKRPLFLLGFISVV